MKCPKKKKQPNSKKIQRRKKIKKGLTPCTRLKARKLRDYAQHVRDVDQDTSWLNTETDILAVTVVLPGTDKLRNKQF